MDLETIQIETCITPEILRSEAQDVTFPLSNELKELVQSMKLKVEKLQGVGLAAPQVSYPVKIIVYSITPDAAFFRSNAFETVSPTILINPSYVPTKDAIIANDWEGCFSVKETAGKVPRYNKIRYTAYNENGQKIESIAEGFTARVLQHEIDHINGILITDRLTKDCIQGKPEAMTKLRLQSLNQEQQLLFKSKLK